MGRIRTHNKRAKRLPYEVFAARRRRAWKLARYAVAYGMKPHRMQEQPQLEYHSHQHEFVDAFFAQTETGRMVARGPNPQYQLPKGVGKIPPRPFYSSGVNYAEQERRALEFHRASLEAARARGDVVIEHTATDATVMAVLDQKESMRDRLLSVLRDKDREDSLRRIASVNPFSFKKKD